MGASRFVRPETTQLPLSNGDWLLVKRRLTHGEQVDAFARETVSANDGTVRVNPLRVGDAKVLAYLVDWSLTDDDGAQVIIRGQSIEVVESALRALDPEDFSEIKAAIDAHEQAMAQERAAEKKTRGGVTSSEPILRSPVAVAGHMSG